MENEKICCADCGEPFEKGDEIFRVIDLETGEERLLCFPCWEETDIVDECDDEEE